MAIGVALLGIIVGQMMLSPVVSGGDRGAAVGGQPGWSWGSWRSYAACRRWSYWTEGRIAGNTARARPSGPERAGAGVPAVGRLRRRARGCPPARRRGPRAFWILMVAGAVLGLGFYAFTAHVVPYATDVGLSATAAALILTVSSIGGAAGTLLAWVITGKLGYRWSLLDAHGPERSRDVPLHRSPGSTWAFYLLGVLIGFAFSAVVPVRMAVDSSACSDCDRWVPSSVLALVFLGGSDRGPLRGRLRLRLDRQLRPGLSYLRDPPASRRRRPLLPPATEDAPAPVESVPFGERGTDWDNRLAGCGGAQEPVHSRDQD